MSDDDKPNRIAMTGGKRGGKSNWMIDTILKIAEEKKLEIEIIYPEPVEVSRDQILALSKILFPTDSFLIEAAQCGRIRDALVEAGVPVYTPEPIDVDRIREEVLKKHGGTTQES